ncbi:MAG: hypothetical protein AB7U20_25465, partial [Planctomycetaceae bacterium]
MSDNTLVPETVEQLGRVGRADLVVGLCEGAGPDMAIEAIRESISRFFPTSTAIVLVGEHAAQLAEAGDPRLCVVASRDWATDPHTDSRPSRVLFHAAGTLGARACALLWAGEHPLDAADLRRLLAPAL